MRIAVAQPEAVAHDVDANANTHAAVIRAAAARLVVFPELSLTGYNLDAAVVAVDDARLAPIVSACAETGATALVGAPIADADGREYIATLLVDAAGVRIVYRKIHLHPPEDDRFASGDTHAVLDCDDARIGLAICRDASRPEHAEATVAAGANVYVASVLFPRADPRDARMRERAMTHGVPVALSSAAGLDGGLLGSGGSGFWAADGSVIAQAGPDPGHFVVADLP